MSDEQPRRGDPGVAPLEYPIVLHLTVRPWHMEVLERIADRNHWRVSRALSEILDAYLAGAQELGVDEAA
jgi:hypothetical protein